MASPKIQVEETNLEDLIILGEDKLINCTIEFPTENGNIKAKTKIKQLTMREVKNIDMTKPDLETSVEILKKSLHTEKGEPFQENLILALPVGVVYKLSEKIMEISGVQSDNVKKP